LKFKARIAILAIIALAAISGAGAMASTASAANCAVTTYAIGRYVDNGYQVMSYEAALGSCSGVDKVEFYYSGSGFWDYTQNAQVGVFHQAYLDGGTVDETFNVTSSGFGVFYAQTCWYGGGAALLHSSWKYRIHNSAGQGSWGTQHVTGNNPFEYVTC